MPDIEPLPIFEMDLGDQGHRLTFKTPEELWDWNRSEREIWGWLNKAGSPMSDRIINDLNEFHKEINSLHNDWIQDRSRPPEMRRIFVRLQDVIKRRYVDGKLLNSASPPGRFVLDLKSSRGEEIAVGAYAGLVGAMIATSGDFKAAVFEGMIEAFLFKREIDWTAGAQQQLLGDLRIQYESQIVQQNIRFGEIEDKNRTLNDSFDQALKQKREALEQLHEEQREKLDKLIGDHAENIKTLERTYDKALALQKPVKYWEEKRSSHALRSQWFGGIALALALISAGGLAWSVYALLRSLGATENPKHWQLGILLIGSFFAVWIVRVFVRLFFSHLHLATDAAERRMMILTYLAMSRQGTQFNQDDMKLIVQHIFRSASDGLVKDDAAPPSVFEWITRK